VTAFGFRVLATDGAARMGEIATAHGIVRTPAFMPVGTVGTVKGLYPEEVRATGADILLGNTYHLMLRPGAERVAALGGLHGFMKWPHAILTDSGGFQVMSLDALRKLDERGVVFRSHIDGSEHELTPERAVEIQSLLGADIQMQLDECLRLPAERAEVERAMRLSLRWAERARRAFDARGEAAKGRALYGIVQGGDAPDLRTESARALVGLDFPGYAIGGLAVGEPQAVMLRMVETATDVLPGGKPRYLMGVGTPDDLLEAIGRGVDQFDCVMPTRSGRHGQAFTRFGKVNLRNARHGDDPRPLDPELPHPAARDYARAYLHHLVRAGELLGAMMLTAINLTYYQQLMLEARAAIEEKRFAAFVAETKAGWARGDAPADG
jgi:queuine tRNA-ribosyltransferase